MTGSPMAIVGAGALGQLFAAALAASGVPTTLLATPRAAAQLRAAGRIRLYGKLELEVPVADPPAPAGCVALTTDPGRLRGAAALVFATKAHQLAAAIDQVRPVWSPAREDGVWVAGVQNGVLKDDLLRAAFGPAALAAASGVAIRDFPNFFPIRTAIERSDEAVVAAARAAAAQPRAPGPEWCGC